MGEIVENLIKICKNVLSSIFAAKKSRETKDEPQDEPPEQATTCKYQRYTPISRTVRQF